MAQSNKMSLHFNQAVYPREYALHSKYAQSEALLDLVWTHCVIIADVVTQLYQKNPTQFEFPLTIAIQAALCHDLGAYLCSGFEWLPDQPLFQAPYAQHTVIGAWLLQKEGYPPEVVQAAFIHSGVGLTSDDISQHQLQLPIDSYVPSTQLQRLITYASKFHSKTPRFKSIDEIRESLTHFGNDKQLIFNQLTAEFGEPDYEALMTKYAEWHRAFAYDVNNVNSPQHAGFNSAGISTNVH